MVHPLYKLLLCNLHLPAQPRFSSVLKLHLFSFPSAYISLFPRIEKPRAGLLTKEKEEQGWRDEIERGSCWAGSRRRCPDGGEHREGYGLLAFGGREGAGEDGQARGLSTAEWFCWEELLCLLGRVVG